MSKTMGILERLCTSLTATVPKCSCHHGLDLDAKGIFSNGYCNDKWEKMLITLVNKLQPFTQYKTLPKTQAGLKQTEATA